jgi:hypothetical protein
MGGVVSSEDESRKRDEEDESEDEDSHEDSDGEFFFIKKYNYLIKKNRINSDRVKII